MRIPDIATKVGETRGHDAYQRARLIVEQESFPENLRVAVAILEPHFIAHDEHGRSAGFPILGMEATPAKRLDTQEVERIGSNAYALETLGPLVSRIQDIEIVDADYVFKSVRFAPQLHEFRRGVRTASAGPAALQIVDLHGNYALGLSVWEGLEEHVFDDAKNSRGGSDSET